MYKSEVHTPASNCSAGTGVCSLGPPGSAIAMDDFDRQLKEKLETLADDSMTYNREHAAEIAAQKVANWKQEIDDLLEYDEGDEMADPYTIADQEDRNHSNECDGGSVSGPQKEVDRHSGGEPKSSDLSSKRTADGLLRSPQS